jgi:uncharacterized protein YqjF (DUF2071 family)
MLSHPGEPILVADWVEVLMVHFEVDPDALQRVTPFTLDLFAGRAFVSLVFFTMHRMRPRRGGLIAEWLFRPVSQHEYLNVRTYVMHQGEVGIYFLAEWLPNVWSVPLGPLAFGLPYRLARIAYRYSPSTGDLSGRVLHPTSDASVSYQGRTEPRADFALCAAGSPEEWLMERYTAFTHRHEVSRLFRVWHPPWLQTCATVELLEDSLLRSNWPWFADAQPVGANYSRGFCDVWMGRPS